MAIILDVAFVGKFEPSDIATCPRSNTRRPLQDERHLVNVQNQGDIHLRIGFGPAFFGR